MISKTFLLLDDYPLNQHRLSFQKTEKKKLHNRTRKQNGITKRKSYKAYFSFLLCTFGSLSERNTKTYVSIHENKHAKKKKSGIRIKII